MQGTPYGVSADGGKTIFGVAQGSLHRAQGPCCRAVLFPVWDAPDLGQNSPLLICGTLAFMSLGLLAGSVSKTVEGATSLANIFVLPMAFLAGSFFSLDGAPTWLNVTSHLLPLRYLNDGMLDVMVRGQGPGAAVVPMLILLGFAAVVVVISSRFFAWESE